MLQTSINFLYRLPKATLKKYKRFGGYYNYQKILNGNKQMARAAHKLPPSVSYADGLPIHFLTGEKFIHQTLFCIRSLIKVSNEQFHFILVDDGTFTIEISKLIAAQLPEATIIPLAQVTANIEKHLPADKFPVLNHKRKVYPHIKKLIDIHIATPHTWKLVLDSDMLFWKEPATIINWLKQPSQPIHMLDCNESYGYSEKLMSALSNSAIPKLLNVGVIGLNSSAIQWDVIESWVKQLEESEGTSYYLEQALSAMIVGDTAACVLAENDYKVNPSLADLESKANILHHYVDLSKEIYLKKAWQLIL